MPEVDPEIEKTAGIGPGTGVVSRPLNEMTPLTGPPLFSAGGNDRQSAFAGINNDVSDGLSRVDGGIPADAASTGPYPAGRLLPINHPDNA